MAISDRLSIVRDIWWLSASSGVNGYVTNENNKLPSLDLSLRDSVDQDLGADDTTYIENGDENEGVYYFRVSHNTIVPSDIKLKIRGEASNAGTNEVFFILTVNETQIGEIGPFGTTASNLTKTFTLNNDQIRAVLDARVDDFYDYFELKFSDGTTGTTEQAIKHAKMYAVEIYYENSDDRRYENHTSSVPGSEIKYFYPSGVEGINQPWLDDGGSSFTYSGGVNKINQPPSGVDTDDTYLEAKNDAGIYGGPNTLPSGYLSMSMGVMDQYDPMTKVNRALLSLRMAFPPSGDHSNNARDSFEVVGKNPNFSAEGHPRQDYVLWGAGEIIQQSGFKTYQTDLAFLDPDLYENHSSGVLPSLRYNKVEAFEGIEFRVWGIPSGTQLSSAELRLESQVDSYAPLFIPGEVENCSESIDPNLTSSLENRFIGNWEHSTSNKSISNFFGEGYFRFKDEDHEFDSESNTRVAKVVTIPDQGGTVNSDPTVHRQYSNPISNFNDNWLNAVALNIDGGNSEYLDFGSLAQNRQTFFGHFSPKITDYFSDHFTLISVGDKFTSTSFQDDREFTVSLFRDILRLTYQDQYGTYNTLYLSLTLELNDDIFVCVSHDDTIDSEKISFFAYTGGTFYSTSVNDILGRISTPYVGAGDISLSSREYVGYVHEFGISDNILSEDEFKAIINARFKLAGGYIQDDTSKTIANEDTYWELDFVRASGEIREEASFVTLDFPSNLYNISYPHSVDYDQISVAPSAVSFDIVVEHESDHPSGVELYPTLKVSNGETSATYQGYLHIPSGSSKQLHTVYNRLKENSYVPRGSDDNLTGNIRLNAEYNHYNDRYYDGNLKIYYAKVNVDAWCTAVEHSGDVPLYTTGGFPNESLDLFLFSNKLSEEIDLHIHGKELETDSIDLYTLAGAHTNNTKLFVHGRSQNTDNVDLWIGSSVENSGDIPLYIDGIGRYNEEINLFTEGLDPPDSSGDTDLFMWATSNPALYSIETLYLEGPQFDDDYKLNLYIKGDPGFSYTESMNTFIEGWAHGTESSGDISLFLEAKGLGDYEPEELNQLLFSDGNDGGVFSKFDSMPLYILPPSGTTYTENMDLYIERDSEAIAHQMYLFTTAPSGTNDNVSMYVDGVFMNDNNITIYMSGGHTPEGRLDFYSHGF